MRRLSIVDAHCPRAYDERDLERTPLGGTESAVLLLVRELAREVDVEVLQHARRDERTGEDGVRYAGAGDWREVARRCAADTVVVLNSPKLLALWRRNAPPTLRLVLWRHNWLGNRHDDMLDRLRQAGASMVCVSDAHLRHSLARLRVTRDSARDVPITSIPNPVAVTHPPTADVDIDKLLFCSSPHKGLDEVVAAFAELRRRLPTLRLHVCNPGYLADAPLAGQGIVARGALSRPALHAEMASSLCVFYPQTRFAETFGLVAAEANALGTPVLAPAALGALPEVVCGDRAQLLDDLSPTTLYRRVRAWRDGERPRTSLRPAFEPAQVAARWRGPLALATTASARRARTDRA